MAERLDRQELNPQEIARLLQAAADALAAEVAVLPERLLVFHPAPGEWCVKEVVGHLIEAEQRGFAGRIRTILAEDRPRLQAWDQNEVARSRRDCEGDAAALLREFQTLRRAGVTLAEGLRPADLARGGEHPKVGWLTVGDLLQEWVHHDRNHLKQILANAQAYVWPAMGNAQRFSDE